MLILALLLLQDVRFALQAQPTFDGTTLMFAGTAVPLPSTEGDVRFWLDAGGLPFVESPDDGPVVGYGDNGTVRISDGEALTFCGYATAVKVYSLATWWQMKWTWVRSEFKVRVI